MKSIWPAATLAILVAGYFAWSSYASSPENRQAELDNCHRLAGQVQAIHASGGTLSDDLLGTARGCSVAFGQNWAAGGGERAAALRAEGAVRAK